MPWAPRDAGADYTTVVRVVGEQPMRPARVLAAGAAVATLAAGCNRSGSPAASGSAQSDAPVAVTVVAPITKTLATAVEQPATIQPFEVTPIVAKLAGYLKSVKVDIGDVVKGPIFRDDGTVKEPGTLLAEFDIPELVQEGEQKEALVRAAAAEKEQAAQSLVVATEQVAAA